MFVSEGTDGRIIGVRLTINNCVRLFLADGGTADASLVTKESFFEDVRRAAGDVSESFLETLYNFLENGGR